MRGLPELCWHIGDMLQNADFGAEYNEAELGVQSLAVSEWGNSAMCRREACFAPQHRVGIRNALGSSVKPLLREQLAGPHAH